MITYKYKARCFYVVEGEIDLEKSVPTNEAFKAIREKHNVPTSLGMDLTIEPK